MDIRIRCVAYKDDYSAKKSSYNDLVIGNDHSIVGCGSSVFGASRPGDFVLITGEKSKKKYTVIGILEKYIPNDETWSKEGGHIWPHNWTYRALTPIFEVDKEMKEKIKKVCEEHSLNPNCVFHSRFCGIRNKPVVDMMVREKSL